jgi:hypothetical protein
MSRQIQCMPLPRIWVTRYTLRFSKKYYVHERSFVFLQGLWSAYCLVFVPVSWYYNASTSHKIHRDLNSLENLNLKLATLFPFYKRKRPWSPTLSFPTSFSSVVITSPTFDGFYKRLWTSRDLKHAMKKNNWTRSLLK